MSNAGDWLAHRVFRRQRRPYTKYVQTDYQEYMEFAVEPMPDLRNYYSMWSHLLTYFHALKERGLLMGSISFERTTARRLWCGGIPPDKMRYGVQNQTVEKGNLP